MDFEDFLKKKDNTYKKHTPYNYPQKDKYKYYSNKHGNFNPVMFINGLKNNRKLRLVFIVLLIVVIAIFLGLIAILLSLSTFITDYISQNGFSSLLDEAIGFLNILWNGAE